MTKGIPKPVYSPQFINEVIQKVLSGEKPSAVAIEAGVPYQTIYRWLEKRNLPTTAKGRKSRGALPEARPETKQLAKSAPKPGVPLDWQYRAFAEYYKECRGKFFRFDGFEWVLSSRTLKEVRRESKSDFEVRQ